MKRVGALLVLACGVAAAAHLASACASNHDTTPYEGRVPASPTHCGGTTCATDEYCRPVDGGMSCVAIPVIGL